MEGRATLEIEVLMFATIAPAISVARMMPAFAGTPPSADVLVGAGLAVVTG
jgi:hypothetical protein